MLAYDEETGEQEYKEVVRLFRNQTYCWYHLKVNGEEIQCTAEHPFYVESKGFVPASKLTNQDKLVQADGTIVEIQSIFIEHLAAPETTYNFEVAEYHTYYVAEQGILAHNACADKNISHELTNEELRNFGEAGKNRGFRQVKGSHEQAMDFVRMQTKSLSEYQPGKFVGYNTRGVEFRIFPKYLDNYTSIRIAGVEGLKGIKFMWR